MTDDHSTVVDVLPGGHSCGWVVISLEGRRTDKEIFNCNRGLIPDCWRSYRERKFTLVLGTESFWKQYDLRFLGISGKCNRLTKYVGC